MRRRGLITGLLGLLALVAVFWVVSQQRELANVRAEQSHVLAQLTAEPIESSQPAAPPPERTPQSPASNPELLQLRSEITRLTQRKRELADVTAENDRLRVQLASRDTNAGRFLQLGTARMVGYNTPESTLESMLWAFAHRDFTNLLQAFAPEVAQAFPIQTPEAWTNAMNEFHEQFPGFSILSRRDLPDGRVELTVQIVGHSDPEPPVHLRQVNGQWKIEDLK